MPEDQRFTFGYGEDGLQIEGKDGDDIVLVIPWNFLSAFALIVTAFAQAHDTQAV